MTEETQEKSENGFAGEINHADEKPKLEGDPGTEEAQLEKVPYPKSVFFILSNEICERFSFYGMRTILSLYLRDMLLFSESDSTIIYHTFTLLAYFFPILGAILSDSWLGKFKTILYVSMVYAVGSILLALSSAKPLGIPQVPFSMIGLLLIAIGTGGIKPCVSAFGGDQFVLPQQELQLVAFFSIFYFAINGGSLVSTFLTPVLREDVKCFDEDSCYPLAFGVPGILMIVSIIIFVLGSPLYKKRKPEGNIFVIVCKCIWYGSKKNRAYKKNNKNSGEKVDHWLDHAVDKYGRTLVEDIKITLKTMVVFTPLPVFWALYDQQGSGWTFQATRMDGRLGSTTILPDQMQVINPILIMLAIPLFTYVIYPYLAKYNIWVKPLNRMVWGGFIAAAAFAISAGVSFALEAGDPKLPSNGNCQLRVYNPASCDLTLTINDFGINKQVVNAMGYSYHEVECHGTKNYTYAVESSCVSFSNTTGELTLKSATGYVLWPSEEGFLLDKDDIDKSEDGFPKIRTLTSSSQSDLDLTYYDGGSSALTISATNYTFQSLDPGTYKLGNKSLEFNLGGVYTVLVDIDDDSNIKNIVSFEVTKPNNVHMLVMLPQIVIITIAEILFSITGLEFSYSQAPKSMKSLVTGLFLLTSCGGNLLIVIIESIHIFDKQSYMFLLYTGLMLVDMILFTFLAARYKYPEKRDEENEKKDDEEEKKEEKKE